MRLFALVSPAYEENPYKVLQHHKKYSNITVNNTKHAIKPDDGEFVRCVIKDQRNALFPLLVDADSYEDDIDVLQHLLNQLLDPGSVAMKDLTVTKYSINVWYEAIVNSGKSTHCEKKKESRHDEKGMGRVVLYHKTFDEQ